MIVKNEGAVIARCLRSCRELIDRWVICDTGSTDGTPEIVARELAGIPGQLHRCLWQDFGHNRSELMRLAYGMADYLLLIDADMTVRHTGRLDALGADAYMLSQGDARFDYRNKRLVRGDLRWRYVGATHEYISCMDVEREVENLDALAIVDHGDGGSKANKFERDRALLEAELERDPHNPRATFYLAQTWRDMGLCSGDAEALARARDLYRRRVEIGGWDEETYCAWRQMGLLDLRGGSWPQASAALLAAWETRPERLEAVHDLVIGLLDRRQHHSARRFTGLVTERRLLPPSDLLFVEPWVYEWGLLFQHSIATYWCGEFDASMRACKLLLANRSLPEEHRSQTELNLRYAVRERARTVVELVHDPVRVLPHAGTPTRGQPA